MPRARVRVPGRMQKKRQRRGRWGRAKHFTQCWPLLLSGRRGAGRFCAKWPRPCPPPHAAFRTRCTRTVQRIRSEAHYAAAVPRLARLASYGGAGRNRPKRRPALPTFRPRPGRTGTPPLVRIRTDTFLRREKCPRCRVRGCVSPGGRKRNGNAACGGDGPGGAFSQSCPSLCPGGARPGGFARNGRVPVRRRTRRFGHAALTPCSVFAPRRTTRRQCHVWLGFHRAAGGEKPARAPPCLAGLLIQTRETPPG